ncbi:hypothetical protein [Actinoplanes sp. NPDC051494]|uniref:hypothetical protein n=1 Tax=Actinoplanes sp. NPDC051494 TaxID=3363907 RepID=UPI00378FF6CF
MRTLGSRRAMLATGVAAVASIALAGCSAGQVAETALKRPSTPGVNADNANRSVFIRNLSVAYPGTKGYARGATATLEVGLYNQTTEPVTVLISSQPATGVSAGDDVVAARLVALIGGGSASPAVPAAAPSSSATPTPSPAESSAAPSESASPEESASPSASPSPSVPGPKVEPARIELPPLGGATFLPDDVQKLQALNLDGKLVPGAALNLTFEFSNGTDALVVQAPVSTPLAPASRGAADIAEDHE